MEPMLRLLLFLVLLAGALRADEAAVGSVVWVRGVVQVTRAGRQQPEDARAGTALFRGDRIAARPGADAGLLVGGAARELSRLPEARWTAGEPLDAGKPALDRVKESLLGKPDASRAAGPDFAHQDAAHDASRPGFSATDVAHGTSAPTVLGGLSPEVTRRVFAEHRGEIRAAYVKALEQNPHLAGKVVVQFELGPSGQVVQSQARESTTGAPDFDRRLAELVRGFKFPAVPGGAVLTYPFVFKQ